MRYDNKEVEKSSLDYYHGKFYSNIPDKEIKFVTYRCMTHRNEEELTNIKIKLMDLLRACTGLYIHPIFISYGSMIDDKDKTKTLYTIFIKDKNENRIKD